MKLIMYRGTNKICAYQEKFVKREENKEINRNGSINNKSIYANT